MSETIRIHDQNARPEKSSSEIKETDFGKTQESILLDDKNEFAFKPRPIPKVKSLSESSANSRILSRQTSANLPVLIHESSTMSLNSKEDVITVKYLPMSNDSLNRDLSHYEISLDDRKMPRNDVESFEAQITSQRHDASFTSHGEKHDNVS